MVVAVAVAVAGAALEGGTIETTMVVVDMGVVMVVVVDIIRGTEHTKRILKKSEFLILYQT
jgi:hypothetical protein